ncbi:hypothetical protein [uncultured Dysosmobacter sp.]|uniref:hypothetical protein n=1 Tax=uncultured Dysosmobacter sp. TaxID=2591384 RepID=UPI002615002F|nr:hypothetical protein [uncultured Dysosmobacter sp.]
MSDFMKWLYIHYIKPYLDTVPQDDYFFWLSLMDSVMTPDMREKFEKCQEFAAIHAFLLGLRTGQGLPVPMK